jgi:tetratricopeptide (TPR) repeat protein
MTAHPDRLTLLSYVEDDLQADREPIAAHLGACAECAAAVEELRAIVLALSQGDLLLSLDADAFDREELYEELLQEYDSIQEEWTSAEAFFLELLARPIETWDLFLARHSGQRTYGLARRLFAEVEVELNRRPEYALVLVGVAERIAGSLPDAEARTVRGDAWKHRSNALRHLGRYDDALAAAETAEALYGGLITGAFDVAQAQYARAVTLFKMTRFAEALQVISAANATLRDFGVSVPLAKTIMLEASIRIDQGDAATAQRLWREVLPMLERTGDAVERARVLANLGECNLRLGHLGEAMRDVRRAVTRYRELGMETEAVRSEWTAGMIHLARGESDAGLDVLENAAAAFEIRGMTGDAGFVKLDVCEELLRRGDWADAELIARELVRLFTKAGVTLAAANALDQLRRAVETREATAETVQWVREWVAALPPKDGLLPITI